jgi:hypothetical protein
MSMSTPQGGGSRKPSAARATTSPAKAPGAGAKPAVKAGQKTGAKAASGARRRPPVVEVKPPRNWTPIYISALVAVIALGIVGYGVYNAYENGLSWQQKADSIHGVVDYRKKDPKLVTSAERNHVEGVVNYPQTPPVGGNHNPNWQRCMGDVYTAQIANENAVHSMEHGAVWITYDPAKLNAAQIEQLAAKVRGNNFMLMSPYPNEGSPISVQVWGLQLKVDSPTDSRIDQFIQDTRQNASVEPGADCSSGTYITATGTQPHDPTDTSTTAPSAQPSS